MAKAKYGKYCRRDVKEIRKILKTKMKDFSREWAERGGGSASEWWDFLREKLEAEIRALPIVCG